VVILASSTAAIHTATASEPVAAAHHGVSGQAASATSLSHHDAAKKATPLIQRHR
jgi:hypothetical protein